MGRFGRLTYGRLGMRQGQLRLAVQKSTPVPGMGPGRSATMIGESQLSTSPVTRVTPVMTEGTPSGVPAVQGAVQEIELASKT